LRCDFSHPPTPVEPGLAAFDQVIAAQTHGGRASKARLQIIMDDLLKEVIQIKAGRREARTR
jgi:hypothetical protein